MAYPQNLNILIAFISFIWLPIAPSSGRRKNMDRTRNIKCAYISSKKIFSYSIKRAYKVLIFISEISLKKKCLFTQSLPLPKKHGKWFVLYFYLTSLSVFMNKTLIRLLIGKFKRRKKNLKCNTLLLKYKEHKNYYSIYLKV